MMYRSSLCAVVVSLLTLVFAVSCGGDDIDDADEPDGSRARPDGAAITAAAPDCITRCLGKLAACNLPGDELGSTLCGGALCADASVTPTQLDCLEQSACETITDVVFNEASTSICGLSLTPPTSGPPPSASPTSSSGSCKSTGAECVQGTECKGYHCTCDGQEMGIGYHSCTPRGNNPANTGTCDSGRDTCERYCPQGTRSVRSRSAGCWGS